MEVGEEPALEGAHDPAQESPAERAHLESQPFDPVVEDGGGGERPGGLIARVFSSAFGQRRQ